MATSALAILNLASIGTMPMHLIVSALRVLQKLSATALSRQLAQRLMLSTA